MEKIKEKWLLKHNDTPIPIKDIEVLQFILRHFFFGLKPKQQKLKTYDYVFLIYLVIFANQCPQNEAVFLLSSI
jgi:hypothetical protein